MNTISRKCLRIMLLSQAGRDAGRTVVFTKPKPHRIQSGISRKTIHSLTEGPLAHHGVL